MPAELGCQSDRCVVGSVAVVMLTALDEFEDHGADRAGVEVDELPVGFPVGEQFQFAQLGNGLCVNPKRPADGGAMDPDCAVSARSTPTTRSSTSTPRASDLSGCWRPSASRCPHRQSGCRSNSAESLSRRSSPIGCRRPERARRIGSPWPQRAAGRAAITAAWPRRAAWRPMWRRAGRRAPGRVAATAV